MIASRRMVIVGVAAAAVLPAVVASQAVPPNTVLVEQTFLKAMPDSRADLARFIRANWFVMDQAGVDQGIFTFFALYEDIDPNAEWDLVVAVGYPQAQGYEAPATKAAFDKIRAAHKVVTIGGKGLPEMGRIVALHRLKLATR